MMRNRISKIIVIGVVSSALLAACTMPGMHNGLHNGQMGQGGMGEGKKGQGEMGQGMGMGGNGGMMRFHQATIPAEYAGKTSPVTGLGFLLAPSHQANADQVGDHSHGAGTHLEAQKRRPVRRQPQQYAAVQSGEQQRRCGSAVTRALSAGSRRTPRWCSR